MKAYDMSQNGVTTRGGVKLLNPEDITTSTKVMRALGAGSDQVATKREELYYGKILTQRKFKVGVDRLRNKAKNHYSEYLKYDQRENNYKAKEEFNAYKDTLKEYIAFAKKNKIPLDLPAFNRSIFEASRQRLNAKIDRKSIKKHSRQNFDKLQEVLGTSDR